MLVGSEGRAASVISEPSEGDIRATLETVSPIFGVLSHTHSTR